MRTTTFRTHLLQAATAFSLGLMLTACGGGDGGSQIDRIVTGSSSSANSSSSSLDTTQVRDLGRGSGADFVPGEIATGVSGTLSPGGTTTLTVNVVSGSGNLVTESIGVTFNSRCIAAQEAILSDASVTTTNGEATVTYQANGCVGEDVITATASHQGSVLSAQTTITVEADTVGSIQFVDATPSLISLKGTGGNEVSIARFLVKGGTNAPIKGVCVDFSLNTTAGGLTLNDSKCEPSDPDGSKRAKTDAAGYASISIQAGTIATPVRVLATDLNTGLSTQSSGLRVSTGVPDQKSFSLAASSKNPMAWEYDNTIVTFTVLLADAFYNPPADGTVVSFTTNAGAISESCTTENGECQVTWRSQNPRPADGKVRVLAHTVGNESFKDVNGNGWYDLDVDVFAAPHNHPSCRRNAPPSTASGSANACDDLPEAYLDENHNGQRDPTEFFIDFNEDRKHSTNGVGDGLYNGVLCRLEDERNGWCSRSGVTIRQDYMLVMSSNKPLMQNGYLPQQLPTIKLEAGKQETLNVLLSDINNNALPAGTQISINLTEAEELSASPTSLTIPSTVSPQSFSVTLRGTSETTDPSGYIVFEITTPDGLVTQTKPTNINE